MNRDIASSASRFSSASRAAPTVLSALCVVHYAVGMYWYLLIYVLWRPHWTVFVAPVAPCAVLLALSVYAFYLAQVRHSCVRQFLGILVVASAIVFVAQVGYGAPDAQVTSPNGRTGYYFTWWWYERRY